MSVSPMLPLPPEVRPARSEGMQTPLRDTPREACSHVTHCDSVSNGVWRSSGEVHPHRP
jgi:hypothetical protein